MGMTISTIAALSTFYNDAKDIFSPESRKKQTYRLIGKMPTIAAFAYRHTLGMPYVYPDNDLSYPGNFLNMLFRTSEAKYRPNPTLERALDILFILHADHEQNCSANTIRSVGSSHVDPYSATAAAIAALYGPLHGGANEEVLRMLLEIGSVQNVPAFIKRVKAGETKLMGVGHRVYKNYDPRARIIKHIAYQVFDLMGKNPLLEIALECERIALEDEYFIKRKLYPNVDFYTGLIYQSMGFPMRSEEHTSELQSRLHLVCRLLLEKKKKKQLQRLDVCKLLIEITATSICHTDEFTRSCSDPEDLFPALLDHEVSTVEVEAVPRART